MTSIVFFNSIALQLLLITICIRFYEVYCKKCN
jgi:hypothetical protein